MSTDYAVGLSEGLDGALVDRGTVEVEVSICRDRDCGVTCTCGVRGHGSSTSGCDIDSFLVRARVGAGIGFRT